MSRTDYGEDLLLKLLQQSGYLVTKSLNVFDLAVNIRGHRIGFEYKNAHTTAYQPHKFIRFSKNQHIRQKHLALIWDIKPILVINDDGKLFAVENYFDIVQRHQIELGQKTPVVFIDEFENIIPIEVYLQKLIDVFSYVL